MEFKIDKGFKMPHRGPRSIYPFVEMEIGDSFLVTNITEKIHYAASVYGKRHGMKFSLRTVEDGVRVWRVE